MSSSSKNIDVSRQFDIAVIGAGLSGCWLCKALLENPATSKKKILLIDPSLHHYPPKTWCFWEKDSSELDKIVEKTWRHAEFMIGDRRLQIDLHPYAYKMIDAGKLRDNLLSVFYGSSNITLAEDQVLRLTVSESKDEKNREAHNVRIETATTNYHATRVFDSRWHPETIENYKGHLFYQQFSGRLLRADKPVFNDQLARLMDFRVPQPGCTAFCYVLPLDGHTALVEYTLFTPVCTPWGTIEQALDDYLIQQYPNTSFETHQAEQGVIPMSDFPFPAPSGPILPIGTAGGCTKPSSGYTFSFIRRHTEQIIDALNKDQPPPAGNQLSHPRFMFYDRVLLGVLKNQPQKGAGIFFRLFEQNPAPRVLGFMDNQSSFKDELRIFSSLPIAPFLQSAVGELFSTKNA